MQKLSTYPPAAHLEPSGRAPVLDKLKFARAISFAEDVRHRGVNKPQRPTPAHSNGSEAIVDKFVWLQCHPAAILPNFSNRSLLGGDREVEGEVLGKAIRVELAEAVLEVSASFPQREFIRDVRQVHFGPR